MASRWAWIAWALVLVGLARAALLVAANPLLGYANQYDMIRTSACIGFYPDLPPPKRFESTREGPQPLYVTDARRPDLCYASTEVALDAVAIAIAEWKLGRRGVLPLRAVGYVKLVLLALTVLLVAFALHNHPAAALWHGLVVLLVVSDPVATLWMNSLYTEFATLWSIYAAVAAIGALALTERGRYPMAALLALALAALAFSREQFALLPPVLVVLAWPWLWHRSRHLTVAVFGVALVTSIVSFGLLTRSEGVQKVNRTDTYLGAVLPASRAPRETLARLGLPARCEPLSGATWYVQRGESVDQACPEVFSLPSTAFLRLLPGEAGTVARTAARVLPTAQPVSPRYMGTSAGRPDTAIDQLPRRFFSPIDAIFSRLPASDFEALVLAAFVAGPLALLGALAWGRPGRPAHGTGLLVTMLLSAIAGYAFFTTVFGDGWAESGRHFLPGTLAIVAMIVGAPVAIVTLIVRWRAAPKAHAVQVSASVAAIAVAAAAVVIAHGWMRSQPRALGVVDGVAVEGNVLRVHGWALDPQGIERLEVRIGTWSRAVPVATPSAILVPLFPGYPGVEHAWYLLEVPVAELAAAGVQGEVPMRVVVQGAGGARSEIDRRRLRITP